jgi:long-chain acyl-CoA synthetase
MMSDSIDLKAVQDLSTLFRKSAERFAHKPAFTIVLGNGMNGNLKYSEVDQLSDQFAIFLREKLHLKLGSRVAVQMPNCLSYAVATIGIFKAGLVLVNVNPLYTAPEMEHQLNDCEADALVTVDLFRDKAEQMLTRTKVKHLVVAELTQFMPTIPAWIAKLVMRYWNKQIPPIGAAYVSFVGALKVGQQIQKSQGVQVGSYSQGMTRDSVAVLQYTGGTTGVSKGAVLSHGNILANVHQLREPLEGRLNSEDEVVLTALPLYHIFAFTVNFIFFYVMGARNILCPSPRPISNLQRAMENYPVSVMSGVNTLYNALNSEDWFRDSPPAKLKMAVAGGMALHSSVASEFKKITGLQIIEGYGLTETSPAVSFNPFDRPKDGSIGIPLPETEVKLVDEAGKEVGVDQPGEILVRGPQVVKEYWKNPEETKKSFQQGWFYTGDIATRDSDGYLKIVDRKKDMILVSGFNVFPNEVEDVLAQHPKIQEVAVIGVQSGSSEEIVVAVVVPRANETIDLEEVRSFGKKFLTPYKVPTRLEQATELPKTPVGKILRKDLRLKFNSTRKA